MYDKILTNGYSKLDVHNKYMTQGRDIYAVDYVNRNV